MHCDLRVRWKVASGLRFRAAISEPKTPSFCRVSGDLAPSTRKSLAIAIVRFWCAKFQRRRDDNKNKVFAFQGGGGPWGQRGKLSKNAVFRGKRHNKILKVQILLSRNVVVVAQAPKVLKGCPLK